MLKSGMREENGEITTENEALSPIYRRALHVVAYAWLEGICRRQAVVIVAGSILGSIKM